MRRLGIFALRGFGVVFVLVAVLFIYGRAMIWLSAGRELVALCPEATGDSQVFQIEGAFTNEFRGPSDPAPWCSAESNFGGRSTGNGTGTIGEFEFFSTWCIIEGVLKADRNVLSTNVGEIFMSEETGIIGDPSPIEAMLRTRFGPPLEFEGVWIITGGTGNYSRLTGFANLVGRQLGGGRTAMAACGVISYE